jgi:hypothetical protein
MSPKKDEDQAEESSSWPKEWIFSVQSSSTEPKSDSSVSKVVQQLPRRIEALQWSKVIIKQPLNKVGAQFVNRHPPIGNEDED